MSKSSDTAKMKDAIYIPTLHEDRDFNCAMAERAFGEGVEDWNGHNKDISIAYRQSFDVLSVIYRITDSLLREKLGEDYTLPIDVRTLAERCNFTIQTKDFSKLEEARDRTFSFVAQLQMRSKLTKDAEGKIAGTISVADFLGETSVRFSIAHELAHYVLRKHNPIGLDYLQEACPGMYPLSDSDELLSDLFAYALLLPYHLFEDIKREYEEDNSRWPVDFSDWIVYLRDKTQMPEYHVVLAYNTIRQYTIVRRVAEARNSPVPWLNNLIAYLMGAKFSKSEIKELLSYWVPQETVTDDVKQIQNRLAETIDVIQEKMRDLEVKKKAAEISNQPGEERFGYSYDEVPVEDLRNCGNDNSVASWKKRIIERLFYLGMTKNELQEIGAKVGISSECMLALILEADKKVFANE